jgi:hypothetical protein
MRRLHILVPLIGIALLCAGCSTVRLSYGQAERVGVWYAESYVSLDRQQSRLLGQQLVDFKQWHCSTQLAGYAAWLREVGDEFQPGVNADRIARRLGDLQQFARVMGDHAAPRLDAISHSLSDAQLAELQRSFDKGNRKYRDRWIDVPEQTVRAERAKRLQARIEWWIGPLGKRQRSLVEAWSRELRMTGPDTLASRTRWQSELVRTLQYRSRDTQRVAQLRSLLAEPDRYWTQGLLEQVEANRNLTIDLLVGVANAMDEAQSKRVRARAAALAADLDGLVCPSARTVADAG